MCRIHEECLPTAQNRPRHVQTDSTTPLGPPPPRQKHGPCNRNYTNWDTGQPDNAHDPFNDDEDCLHTHANDAWNDRWCDQPSDGARMGYVIEYDASAPVPAIGEWGLVAMTLLVLTAGTLLYMRRGPSLA